MELGNWLIDILKGVHGVIWTVYINFIMPNQIGLMVGMILELLKIYHYQFSNFFFSSHIDSRFIKDL